MNSQVDGRMTKREIMTRLQMRTPVQIYRHLRPVKLMKIQTDTVASRIQIPCSRSSDTRINAMDACARREAASSKAATLKHAAAAYRTS